MCNRPIVYLAGPITHTTWDGALSWREHARTYLNRRGIATLNPMRAKDFLEDIVGDSTFDKSWHSKLHESLEDNPYSGLTSGHGITHRDRWDVQRCSLLLANFDGCKGISIGTAMEIAWADAYRKYILTVMAEDNPHYHGMIIEASSLIVPSLSDTLKIIPQLIGKELL